jgi:hypothetical protein
MGREYKMFAKVTTWETQVKMEDNIKMDLKDME